MEDWDIYLFVQLLFDVEIFWCFNIFQVDIVEGWFEGGDDVNEFVWIQFIDFDIKYIDIGKFFKQDVFVFYYWFIGQCVDVVEFQYCGVVGDDCYQVVVGSVFVGGQWIFFDFQVGGCDVW